MLHERLGTRRLRVNDEHRWRFAVKTKKAGQHVVPELTTIVTLDTLLA